MGATASRRRQRRLKEIADAKKAAEAAIPETPQGTDPVVTTEIGGTGIEPTQPSAETNDVAPPEGAETMTQEEAEAAVASGEAEIPEEALAKDPAPESQEPSEPVDADAKKAAQKAAKETKKAAQKAGK